MGNSNNVYLGLTARMILLIGGFSFLYKALAKKDVLTNNAAMLAIGAAACLLAFDRDYYLPFLGSTAMPLLPPRDKQAQGNLEIEITNLPPNASVVYWAAEPGDDSFKLPAAAYGDYQNSGVATADKLGKAIVKIHCPQEYRVKMFGIKNKTLKRHVHYRYVQPGTNGLYSRVFTTYIDACPPQI